MLYNEKKVEKLTKLSGCGGIHYEIVIKDVVLCMFTHKDGDHDIHESETI